MTRYIALNKISYNPKKKNINRKRKFSSFTETPHLSPSDLFRDSLHFICTICSATHSLLSSLSFSRIRIRVFFEAPFSFSDRNAVFLLGFRHRNPALVLHCSPELLCLTCRAHSIASPGLVSDYFLYFVFMVFRVSLC